MSSNGHSLDTEYGKGVVSPPPNKVDLPIVQELLDKAKSIGYKGIEPIPLEPKHKGDSFEPIPICLPTVSQLLKSIGFDVFDGSNSSGNADKKKTEIKDAIKKAVDLGEMTGKLGGGLSSDAKDLFSKVTEAASQFMDPKTMEGLETIQSVYNDVKDTYEGVKDTVDNVVNTFSSSIKRSMVSSSGSSSSPAASNQVTKFSKLGFINLDTIDIKGKKTQNKMEEFLKDPEYIITSASIDKETSSSQGELDNFKKKFSDIKERLVSNIEKYPEKLKAQYMTALSAIDVARGSNQVSRHQLENKYYDSFGEFIQERNDVPESWKPSKPVIKEGVK